MNTLFTCRTFFSQSARFFFAEIGLMPKMRHLVSVTMWGRIYLAHPQTHCFSSFDFLRSWWCDKSSFIFASSKPQKVCLPSFFPRNILRCIRQGEDEWMKLMQNSVSNWLRKNAFTQKMWYFRSVSEFQKVFENCRKKMYLVCAVSQWYSVMSWKKSSQIVPKNAHFFRNTLISEKYLVAHWCASQKLEKVWTKKWKRKIRNVIRIASVRNMKVCIFTEDTNETPERKARSSRHSR